MMRCLLLSAFLLSTAWADGPPMTPEGEVTCDHLSFLLTKEQISEIGRTRRITLNNQQLKTCRALNPKFPDTILVLGPAYNDCTCGMGLYAMWTRLDRISIAVPQIESHIEDAKEAKAESELEAYDAYTSLAQDKTTVDGLTTVLARHKIILDADGNMFAGGHAVSESDFLKAMQTIAVDAKNGEPYLWVNVPPKGDENGEKSVSKRLSTIEAEGAKHKVTIYTTG